MNGTRRISHGGKVTILMVLFSQLFLICYGQTDLKSLLELAESNYPAIAAKQAVVEAAKANVSLEKNSLLPSLDAAYQANYSTYNNITGMSYPGNLMPISGPPSDDNYGAVPGSAASLTLKWSPFTFGQRSASIGYSEKLYEKQLASVDDEVLRVKLKTAFMYLEIVATGELIKACQKNIERNGFNLKQATSLVSAGIRPGVDSLKFKGELSKAKTTLFRLENLLETQKLEVAELLVMEELPDIARDEFFFQNLPTVPTGVSTQNFSQNPALKMAQYDLEANEALLKQINRSWTPKMEFWGTTYARGSGISYDGSINNSDGWSFSRYNYGLGLQLVFPILDLTNVKLKSRRQEALLKSSESNFKQTQITINKQENTAFNDLANSLNIAHEVPVEYKASEEAYRALQTRYNAGLIDYSELIQAQYDLLNAEASLKNACVDTWKSLLKLATIRGDINIFLNQIQN